MRTANGAFSKGRDVHKQRGFTFIEVLIAMLVLGVAVLAFAGLQVRALQTTSISHMRSQAMTLAADLVERMRANPEQIDTYLAGGLYDGADEPAGAPREWASPGDGCMSFENVDQDGCTTLQLAEFDINEVEYLAGQLLPDGRIQVRTCDEGIPGSDCVFVSWNGTAPVDCETNATPNCVLMQVVLERVTP